MSEQPKWHRNFGVYGICIKDGHLLVIHKTTGPYINRFDLPGGNIEANESLIEGIHREFAEETGARIHVLKNIGSCDYLVPFELKHRETTHIHHVAIFYQVKYLSRSAEFLMDKVDNDSKGAEWVVLDAFDNTNSSPLVLQAVNWIREISEFPLDLQILDDWKVK